MFCVVWLKWFKGDPEFDTARATPLPASLASGPHDLAVKEKVDNQEWRSGALGIKNETRPFFTDVDGVTRPRRAPNHEMSDGDHFCQAVSAAFFAHYAAILACLRRFVTHEHEF